MFAARQASGGPTFARPPSLQRRSVAASPLDLLLETLRGSPPRLPSLVITIFGDAVAPRGGSVWLGTLARRVEALGIGEGALRTAMSRLTADGWLLRSRAGRNSFYRLAPKGRRTFEVATEHIYNPPDLPWTGRLRAALLTPGTDREAAGAALAAAGYGSPAP